MSIFKFIYPKSSLKRKILNVEDDIKKIITLNCEESFFINRYGAYDIDPKNLVFWICVKSDAQKLNLSTNKDLTGTLYNLLTKYDYPKEAIPFVHIGFESQETVDRESGGDWYLHFK
ncbi:MAG: hypothetical protein K0R65_853 [Crocinitomicaceae bacterium]|jgi:hypothetical protein|nr:hypothetical protein [Crocinitomicaceae bacterium]